jgi:hypothetical protein
MVGSIPIGCQFGSPRSFTRDSIPETITTVRAPVFTDTEVTHEH